ncbi:histone deacetylase superfamily [Rubrobacter xylanophilus DSM 9941]|uniref:Histone deacetylase superfamily n=1 Tax=Rubrobacter xylanophilus (strain DSM 9941 / JCM 11954 / NBRC 16129 / PRD-1) TaxID=266117 RepID=Q1AWW0_RUBXD|nr:histone deacetylase [Rubrobacter xylanophilus]ABG04118.1 histone deacetylase superfamily [Rubrobacter xylanophilus DSM 9941]
MRVFYSDSYVIPLPEGHRFPMRKYAMLRERVAAGRASGGLREPRRAKDEDLLRAHSPSYLRRVVSGSLGKQELRRLGFPWSERLVERSRRAAGGTIDACLAALEEGIAANLAGGTHHAFADRGEGFCVFNDAAVAIRAVQAAGLVERAAVIDTDVHQGDGTAAIFAADGSVFTFSVHGEKNYPFRKGRSDLDVGLPDGADDGAFLEALSEGLERVLEGFRPQLAVYLAGADPFAGDRLGRLAVSKEGLAERDRIVLEGCRGRGVPVAVTMAGGYARDISDTVEIHLNSVLRAAALHAAGSG